MSNDYGPDALRRLFEERFDEALRALGRFNLAVFGKTGAGKSTLINAVFGSAVAATGNGAPVTVDTHYYQHPDGYLGLYDSQGFETGQSGDAVLAALRAIVTDSRRKPIVEQIHAVWYVVRWSDRRFERSQADFVAGLAALGLPVLIVLTQVPISPAGAYHPDAVQLADFIKSLQLPIAGPVLFTNALADDFTHTPVHGLATLLAQTAQIAPEAAHNALVAAQRVDLSSKQAAANRVISQSAAAAMATGASPIPFSDAALLVPIQVAMVARITTAYGLTLPSAKAASLVGSIMLSAGATTAGRWIATSALRFIPGGNLAAAAISGTVASSITTAVGRAWMTVCEKVLASEPAMLERMLADGSLKDFFLAEFHRRLGRKGSNAA